jgi:hypothetical protein
LALALLSPPPAGAQALVSAGAEFQVNAYTTGFQESPSVASDANGAFVMVWSSEGSSGTDTGSLSIQGQRYAPDGSAQGAQFQVNTWTTGDQRNASVAADADGDFVVVWEGIGSYGTDSSYRSIQGQRYASDGSTLGAQFQVNTYTTNYQFNSSVAADSDGDFVVVWESYGSTGTDSYRAILGQRYDSGGSTQGAEFQVNTFTPFLQRLPSVAADADGDFVVAWQSYGSSGTDTSGFSVSGQRYDSAGSTQGGEFQANAYTTGFQRNASVTADGEGDFVVVWESYGSSGTDTSGYSIQGQRYDSGGSTQGGEFQVNSYTTNDQEYPSVAAAADGSFVVAWNSAGSSGTDTSGDSIQGQRYASDGSTEGGEFQVNTYTTDQQYSTSVAAFDGGVIMAWRSDGSSGTDTSASSILGQRFSLAAAVPAVPSMSSATRFALGAALLLFGAAYALRRRV